MNSIPLRSSGVAYVPVGVATMAGDKVLLPENEKPLMANGKRADVYKVRATRMNIGGHELQPDYILTSDTIKTLSLLLGFNVLRYFRFSFDFDAVDADAPYGRMFYAFRKTCLAPYTKFGEPFAYKLDEARLSDTPLLSDGCD